MQFLYSSAKLLGWAILAKSLILEGINHVSEVADVFTHYVKMTTFMQFFSKIRILRLPLSLLPAALDKLRDSSEGDLGIIFIATFSLIYASPQPRLSTSAHCRFPASAVTRSSTSVQWLPVLLSHWLSYAIPTG